MGDSNEQINTAERIEFLKNTEIFSGSGQTELEEISKALKIEKFNAGESIIRKGDSGTSMYILVKGRVKIHDGGHILTRLEPGKTFGEYSLFDEETRSASVTADMDSLLFKLEQDDFLNLVSKNIEITKGVLRMLIRQMRERNILEEKLAKSYIRIQKQKGEIEQQHESILKQKQLLEEQNFDLISLNEEKNKLISIVVHGLKNPLTSSMCLVDMLNAQKHLLQDNQAEYADIIHNSLHRMNNMINQILNIHTIDSKKFKLKQEKLNLSLIIKEVVKNFHLLIKQKNLELSLKLANIDAQLNKVYTVQIVDNLLSNAIKFSPDNSVINISLAKTDGKIRIEVKDEGPGIAKEDQLKIFHQYSRQSSKQYAPEPPTGLGLAIVKKYTTAMNGKVWCESKKGKGATFIVEFIQ